MSAIALQVSAVSTPSATTCMPSPWASWVTARTTTASASTTATRATKLRSILISATGSSRSSRRDDQPVPKSSSDRRTPATCRAARRARARSMSAVRTRSVISRVSSPGSRPKASSRRVSRPVKSGSSRSRNETLTAIGTVMPARCQAAVCSSDISMTTSVRRCISPDCSATGMKSSGGTRPRTGWRQRTSASTPATEPSARCALGWKCTSIWPCSSATRSSLISPSRAAELSSRVASYTWTPVRSAFAWYIATSARENSSS